MSGSQPQSMSVAEALTKLRAKAELFVPAGFRDEDGVWHDGPHRMEFDAAADALEEQFEAAQEAVRIMGRHLEDCCRTDLSLGEQMRTHNDAVNAAHRAERSVSTPASRQNDEGRPEGRPS